MTSRHAYPWLFITLGVSILGGSYLRASDHTVSEYTATENYRWTRGCAPTAAATVFSYYDNYNRALIGYGALIQWYQIEHDSYTGLNNNVPQVLDWLALRMGTDSSGNTSTINIGPGITTAANNDCGYCFSSHRTTSGTLNDWCWGTITSEVSAGRPFIWSVNKTISTGHSIAAIGYTDTKYVMVYDSNTAGQGVQYYYYNQYPVYLGGGGAYTTEVDTVEPGCRFTSDLSLMSLRSGGTLYAGQSTSIQWQQWGDNTITKVDILYSTDSGNSWSYVAQNVSSSVGSGSYNWTIPSTSGSNYRLRLIGRNSAGNVKSGDASYADFTVLSLQYTISGNVRTSGGAGISGVTMSGLPGSPTTDSSGYYSASVSYNWSGTVTPSATGYSFSPTSRSYSNVTGNQTGQDYTGTGTSVPSDIVFFDDMEKGQGVWTMQAPWGLTTASSHSPNHSWTDSPGGNYPNNTNVSLWTPLIDLTGKTTATLTFWHHFDFAAGDGGYIWILPQGGNFTSPLKSFSGTDLNWHQESIDLSNYVGQVVTIYFQMLSDSSGVADGWYVDDVAVTASAQPRLTGLGLSNGVVGFNLNGCVGSNYVIQVSSDLVNWLTISMNTVPAGGWVNITDSSMSNLPQRFYRALLYAGGTTPVNDLFANRILITGTYVAVSGSNIGASMESGEPFHWSSTGGKSAWWTWQAPKSGTVTISTAGSSFDTILAAYTGNSIGGLTLVQNNDDFGGNLTSQVSFFATSGTVYQIAVDGFGAASGSISLFLSEP